MSELARSYPKHRGQALLAPLLLLLAACATTPVTGRQSFNLFDPAEDVALGREAYAQVLEGERLITSGPQLAQVREVMGRLVAVADDVGYEWRVELLDDDDTVNAFALPGGKMAVYTGILSVCGSDTGLAVVMGHEIGHVVARHGTENVSRSMGAQVILQSLNLGDWQSLAEMSYGLLVDMPFGRGAESEADHIGLIYMARAGYDPRETVAFWARMAEAGGPEGPEFLSTHPSHGTRISDLHALMPEALAIFAEAPSP
jgi:predicted Zn-dependent protease